MQSATTVDRYFWEPVDRWITNWPDWDLSGRTLMTHLAAILIAGGIGIYATNPNLASPALPFALMLMWVGILLSPKVRPPALIIAAVVVIDVSALLAIIFTDKLAPTLLLAYLTLALTPLVFVRNPHIWKWLTPLWLIHALVAFWQWFGLDETRVTGITGNANSAAMLLLIGSIYLLNGKNKAKWVMLPVLLAIMLTGSRWTVLVGSVALVAIFLSRYISWRYIAVGIAAGLFATIAVTYQGVSETWLRPSTAAIHLTGEGFRTETGRISFIPQGFSDNGIHTVPWRMMHETGILSGMAWLLAGAYSLARRPDARWWMFLTVFLGSLMYYHTWIGPLGAFWWLLVSPHKQTT